MIPWCSLAKGQKKRRTIFFYDYSSTTSSNYPLKKATRIIMLYPSYCFFLRYFWYFMSKMFQKLKMTDHHLRHRSLPYKTISKTLILVIMLFIKLILTCTTGFSTIFVVPTTSVAHHDPSTIAVTLCISASCSVRKTNHLSEKQLHIRLEIE